MSLELTEIPFVLAVRRAGSLTGAARALGINHSTAFRKLRLLERRIGEPLFDRLPGGCYEPTPLGERVALTAERLSEEVHQLNRAVLGADQRLSGPLRITTSESIAQSLLLPHLRAFQERHPGIDLELDVSIRQLDLARREADLAVRTVRPVDGGLWGRKVASIAWASYKGRTRANGSPHHAEYIGWVAPFSVRAASWIEKASGGDRIRFRSSSLLQQQRAARAGLGVAVLPCYLGDADPTLERAAPRPITELRDELWIVAHEQLRSTVRIRAFLDVVTPGLRGDAALVEGHRPKGSARRSAQR